MTTLAKRIKRARKAKGITQVILAERAGTTQSIVGQLEAGMLRSSKAVPGIAKALDVSAGYLQYGDENKAAPAREALRKLCEEQQAKIEALLADNATLAEAKGKLAEELEALRDENIALVKEAMDGATAPTGDDFKNLVADIHAAIRVANIQGNRGVDSSTLLAMVLQYGA
jgi:transcriptional regulator with XRE-family HTH domain